MKHLKTYENLTNNEIVHIILNDYSDLVQEMIDDCIITKDYKLNNGKEPILVFSTRHGSNKIVKCLIENGFDVNVDYFKQTTIKTIFSREIYNDDIKEIIKMLFENNVNLDTKDIEGNEVFYHGENIWKKKYIQELLIKYQPHKICKLLEYNIKIDEDIKKENEHLIDSCELGLI